MTRWENQRLWCMDLSYGMTSLNSISLEVGQNLNVYEKYPASFGTNVDVVPLLNAVDLMRLKRSLVLNNCLLQSRILFGFINFSVSVNKDYFSSGSQNMIAEMYDCRPSHKSTKIQLSSQTKQDLPDFHTETSQAKLHWDLWQIATLIRYLRQNILVRLNYPMYLTVQKKRNFEFPHRTANLHMWVKHHCESSPIHYWHVYTAQYLTLDKAKMKEKHGGQGDLRFLHP